MAEVSAYPYSAAHTHAFVSFDNDRIVFLCVCVQGRHVKTGQLAAIKVMDVTEVSPALHFNTLQFGM